MIVSAANFWHAGVSIVIPCFNGAEYLRAAVGSALAQTYAAVDIVVIDDGSTDEETLGVLAGLAGPRVQVVQQANGGPAAARNRAIREATGKYILPLDADDTIEPSYVAKAVAVLEAQPQVGCVYCKARKFGDESGPWDLPPYSLYQEAIDNVIFVTALFRKADWEAVGGFDEKLRHGVEDYDFWLKLIASGKDVVQLGEYLFNYRVHGPSRTSGLTSDLATKIAAYAAVFRNNKDFYATHAEFLYRHRFGLEVAVADLRQRCDGLRRQVDAGHEHVAQLERDLQASAGREVVLEGALSDAREREAVRDRELAAIRASTSWRVLMRVHRLLMHLPPGVRSALRRALKLAWWVITPWRMPARVRFIAHRRADGTAAATPAVQPPTFIYTYHAPHRNPAEIERAFASLSRTPLFSVVVPVYNTDPELLRQMIASVTQQWYPHWQLILVDDHSPAPGVQQVFAELHDDRIVTVRLDTNQRISGATNAGIARATGDFIVFLDHDDELTPDCLYELALCIDRDASDYVYSDEDKLDVDGTFRDPFFKPDWSPDTMMSVMLTCHVSCVRRSLALQVGGLRSEYDGSQDWDFVLRVTEQAKHIAHIPKVLYHWRITPASCASDLQAKPYALDASKRAREDALRRRHLAGEVVPVPQFPGYFRVRYALQGEPLFSIIIPSKNNGAVLDACVASILARTRYKRYEIIVVDNGSTDPDTLARLTDIRQRHAVTVLDHAVPFNYSEINNFGVRHARGSVLVFLNDDTEVISDDWLDYMGGYAQLAHVGAVGAKLLYPGAKQVQHVGVVNLAPGPSHAFARAPAESAGYFMRNVLEYDWVAVTGACLMLERAKFDACGGFDEDLAVAYNDTALCFSLLERGLYNVVCPGVELIHHESLSRGSDVADPAKLARADKERKIALRKHPAFDGCDPFYNPNLDPNHAQFDLRVGSEAFVPVAAASVALRDQPPRGQYRLDALNFRPLGAADPVQLDGRQVTFGGWASDGHGHAADEITLVLSGDTGTYAASTRTCIARPDVAQALHADGLQWSGFCLTASIEQVAPGRYAMYVVKPGEPDAGCKLPRVFVVS